MRAASRLLALGVIAAFVLAAHPAEPRRRAPAGTVAQLLALPATPFAVAHRGFGDNLGEDPGRPIENTVRAVQAGFLTGASVVEVDVQVTRDGEVVALHEDVLPDLTCVHALARDELEARLPHVPSLQAVLNQARRLNQSAGPLRGLLVVDLKAAAPLCDPDDVREPAIVAAVVRAIRQMGMTQQVAFASLSPALLVHAGAQAPEIPRLLTISSLQFLSAPEIEALFGLPVRPVAKATAVGLPWAEVGPLFRLPGYGAPVDVVTTALATGAVGVEVDHFLLAALRGEAAPFVRTLQGLGLKVIGFTVTTAAEWEALEALGVDGIYTNDVPLGVALQAPIP